jgi:hypothetical protein
MMNDSEIALDAGAALFAILAAYYWLQSAWGELPELRTYWDKAPKDDPFFQALQLSAKMNRRAALLSGCRQYALPYCHGAGLVAGLSRLRPLRPCRSIPIAAGGPPALPNLRHGPVRAGSAHRRWLHFEAAVKPVLAERHL